MTDGVMIGGPAEWTAKGSTPRAEQGVQVTRLRAKAWIG